MAVSVPEEVAQTAARFERLTLYFLVPLQALVLLGVVGNAVRAVTDPHPFRTRITVAAALLFLAQAANTVRIARGVRQTHLGYAVFAVAVSLAGGLAGLWAWQAT